LTLIHLFDSFLLSGFMVKNHKFICGVQIPLVGIFLYEIALLKTSEAVTSNFIMQLTPQ